MAVTAEELHLYSEEEVESNVEVDYDDCYVYAYVDDEGQLTHDRQGVPFRVTLEGEYADEDGDWNMEYFSLGNRDWVQALNELAELINEYIEETF